MCKFDKPGGHYVLFVKLHDGVGEYRHLFYDRSKGMWRRNQNTCVGYKCCAAARAQQTKNEKRGWNLPSGWTVFEWGHNWLPC